MKKKFVSLLMVLSLVVLAACSGGGSSSSGSSGGDIYVGPSTVDSFVTLLEDTYGGDFVLVKDPDETYTEGFAVVWDEDMGAYYSYDLANYQAGDNWSEYMAYTEYDPVVIHDWYVDSWGDTVYVGDAYDYNGYYQGEFLFEETEMTGKDLEKIGALQEAYNTSKIADALSAEYGLSEERGVRIAKMAGEWKKLSGSRAMTDADAGAFTKELIGVELSEVQTVMKKYVEGDTESFDSFVDAAAEVNEISPEHMKSIVNAFIK